jgi:thiamine biosynthesis lipoprotein
VLLALALAPLLTGCRSTSSSSALRRFEFSELHMGTLFRITLYAPDPQLAEQAARAAFQRVAELDRMMTDYDPESELMRLCRGPAGEPIPVSDELCRVLQRAQQISELSDGAFDMTVGPYVRLWRRARRAGVLPPEEALAKAGQAVGYQKLRIDGTNKTVTLLAPNMQLDLGGIAKGYAADQALAVLRRLGVPCALVAASGDIAVGAPPPGQQGWRVGVGTIEGPESSLSASLWLKHQAVSTSGDTEQFVEIDGARYSHIVNPKTGVGLTNRIQATIIARDGATTDSLATAVCVLGVTDGLALVESLPRVAALIITKEGEELKVRTSKRFGKIRQAE